MASDSSSFIENELRQLRAAALEESLLARLEACADGSITRLDPAELELEQRLRGMAPARLSPDLMATLQATVATVPFSAAEPKIVRFPVSVSAPSGHVLHQRHWWGAAAAVALFGALAGWLLPGGNPPQPLADSRPAAPAIRPAAPASLVPASFNRGLSEATDEGVIWHSSQQPHRVLKVVYQERATLKDSAGRTYQVEQPRVEYIFVPAKTD
jgi:hypothetical protein